MHFVTYLPSYTNNNVYYYQNNRYSCNDRNYNICDKVTRRSWLLSLFDSVCGEERKVDGLVVFTIDLVGKDIAVDRGVDIGRDVAVDRGVDMIRVLSIKNKDSYNI